MDAIPNGTIVEYVVTTGVCGGGCQEREDGAKEQESATTLAGPEARFRKTPRGFQGWLHSVHIQAAAFEVAWCTHRDQAATLSHKNVVPKEFEAVQGRKKELHGLRTICGIAVLLQNRALAQSRKEADQNRVSKSGQASIHARGAVRNESRRCTAD